MRNRFAISVLAMAATSWSLAQQPSTSDDLTKLRDPRADVRLSAVTTFLTLDPNVTKTSDGRDIINALTDALADRDFRVRTGAELALERFRPDPAPLLPALIRAAKDPLSTDPSQRFAAVQSRIGALILMVTLRADPRQVAPVLAEALSDDEVTVRQGVTNLLAGYKGDASAALPARKRALGDSDPSVRSAAAAAIARIEGGQSR